MTLLEILPSLRSVMTYRLDPTLWPSETHYAGGRITVGGVAVQDIADQYGTPCEILDEADLRTRCRSYRRALPDSEIVYTAADLAFDSTTRLVMSEQLSVRVGSTAELNAALAAGVDPDRLIAQGDTAHLLRTAMAKGVGRVVLDSALGADLLVTGASQPQKVLVQVSLPVPNTIDSTINAVVAHRRLRLVGLRCEVGANIRTPESFVSAIRELVAVMAQIRSDYGLIVTELHLAGQHAVRRRSDDRVLEPGELRSAIDDCLDDVCMRFRFPRPVLAIEPGSALVAGSAVTVVRVSDVRRDGSGTVAVRVDGRWAGCGESHGVAVANRHPTGTFVRATVESEGGTIALDAELPADIRPGDVLIIACTGDLASPRPAVAVRDREIRPAF